MAVGLPLPVCSCGVLPLFQSLVKKGLAPAGAFSFLVAVPEIGFESFLLSFHFLGLEMTWLRIGSAALIALCIGVFMAFVSTKSKNKSNADEAACCHSETEEESASPLLKSKTAAKPIKKLQDGIEYTLNDLLDNIAPWIFLGIAIAALIDPIIQQDFLRNLSPSLQVLVTSFVGIPLYICASGSTPIVAVLIAKGLSPGAALCLLLAGPATNVSTFGVIKNLYNKKTALLFVLSMLTLCLGLGFFVNFYFAENWLKDLQTTAFNSHHLHHTKLQIFSALVLAALFVRAFYRLGPKGFWKKIKT